MLVCGTLVYSRGDEVQSKRDHMEYEAHAAEEGQAQPSVLMPGQLLLTTQILTSHMLSTRALMYSAGQSCPKYSDDLSDCFCHNWVRCISTSPEVFCNTVPF